MLPQCGDDVAQEAIDDRLGVGAGGGRTNTKWRAPASWNAWSFGATSAGVPAAATLSIMGLKSWL